jgi:hypothetical protein
MKPKVLWIEDSARLELASLCGPVFFKGTCDLTLAEDVTTAVNLMLAESFDVLIVDVRLPPGSDGHWQRHYRRTGSDKMHAQLGLKLLYWLLGRDQTVYPASPPAWVRPDRVCVFTVETRHEIAQYLDELAIKVSQEKNADLPDTILDELIRRVLAQAPLVDPRLPPDTDPLRG